MNFTKYCRITMLNNPLVTISIPTFNSEKTLGLCLDAVLKQTYGNFEVNVIDGNSKDKTILIAKEKGVKDIAVYSGALLGARLEGLKMARGEYVLLLDSDQILNKDAIKQAVEKIEQGFDMLIFEETSCQSKTFIEKLFRLDRKLIHKSKDLSPGTGALLPRFFKKDLLEKAFTRIPEEILQKVGGEDHMIIYYEAWQLSKKISILPNAVCHIEPKSL
ncbi:glycosyltransferase family 2 protein, partial [Patescibacteria group bacterium]|nr:glycosyltransferase family 2 protein [Patescibacteria group bacterium]